MLSIPSYLNEKFFEKSLKNGLRELDVKVTNLNITDISISGENYCSNIYQASVKYEMKKQKDQEISLIVKSMPIKKQGVLQRLDIFNKETIFYLDINPKMNALMWKVKDWNFGAKHFYSTDEPEQTIVVEDLSKHGYRLQNRQIGLDQYYCEIVVKKLGQYHALSIVLAIEDPAVLKHRFPHGIIHKESVEAPAFKGLFGSQLLKLISFTSEWEEFKEITPKLQKYHTNFNENVLKAVYPIEGKINALNHGDLWVNNLLFRENATGLPVDLRLIDFQLGYYGSIGFDFNYFFYTSIQLNVMKTQRNKLIQTYYEALSKTLINLNYDLEIPTLEDVEKEIAQREAFGFFVSFAFFPMMTMQRADCQENSLEKFHDKDFADKKIELMFVGSKRTLETLRYTLKRFNDLGVFD